MDSKALFNKYYLQENDVKAHRYQILLKASFQRNL